MITQEHVNNSIDNARAGISNLTEELLKVRGFSTPTIRMLFNNLCNIDGTYLEIGLFCGATFCSSFNKSVSCIGIENHSQDFSAGFDLVKQELKDNVDKFSDRAKEVQIHYTDCFNMSDNAIADNSVNIYFYDGWHSEEMQAKALPYFFDKMANKFIWIVDDINWDYVKSGTDKALEELKDKIEIEQCWMLRGYHLQNDPVFHNGVVIYLINKK